MYIELPFSFHLLHLSLLRALKSSYPQHRELSLLSSDNFPSANSKRGTFLAYPHSHPFFGGEISVLAMWNPRGLDRGGYHRHRNDGYLIPMLLWQLWQQFDRLETKPPVTLALLGLNIYAHMFLYLSISRYCLKPSLLFDAFSSCLRGKKSWAPSWLEQMLPFKYNNSCYEIPWERLTLSGFIHVDDTHLYYNMLSLAYKGISLERHLGSTRFALLVLYALVVSHALAVLISYSMYLYDFNWSGYNSCAVGFSAVLFCMKYIWNQLSPDTSYIYGLVVPSKYAAWLECILISLITPNVSFTGHLAGILAGVIYMYIPNLPMILRNTTSYTYSSGVLGSDRRTQQSDRRHSQHSQTRLNNTIDGGERGAGNSDDILRQRRLNRFGST